MGWGVEFELGVESFALDKPTCKSLAYSVGPFWLLQAVQYAARLVNLCMSQGQKYPELPCGGDIVIVSFSEGQITVILI